MVVGPIQHDKTKALTLRLAVELAEIEGRVRRSLDQADHGEYAEGTGEQAIERAFDRGLKRAGV